MRTRWWRAVQWAAGIAVVFFAARALVRNADQLRATDMQWALSPGQLVLSALAVWAMYVLLIQAWRIMLHGWGERLRWWTAARIWTVSSLGKYVPGKVWAIAGMAMMAQQAGVAAWAATGSAIILQALAVVTGTAVVAVTGLGVLESAYPGAAIWLAALLAASIVGILVLVWPPATRRLLTLAGQGTGLRTPSPASIGFGALANLVAWMGYGSALWLLARGVLPASGLTIPAAIGAFAASYLAGLLALFAPAGLGVREGVFILMLERPLGIGAASALALASRLLLTITELGAAAPFVLARREGGERDGLPDAK
ncbi:MAG: lysylphosphatidylglycerol synthase domain-containing protein [Gemmatimonadota bacterium]